LPRLALPFEQSRAELSIRAFAAPVPRRTLVLAWQRRSFLADALRQIAVAIRSAYPVPTPPGLTS
jgi:hypothetical protein